MRLGLSSAAAPDAGLDALLEIARRRGLYALELRAGDEHGVTPQQPAGWAAAAARDAGVQLAAYRAGEDETADELAELSVTLGTRVLLAGREAAARARAVNAAGGRAAVLVTGPHAVEDAEVAAAAGLAVAWEVQPLVAHAGDTARALLRLNERLVHITLVGGGPEVAMQDGRGVGELMGRIALAGWDGALAVAPSSPRFRIAWQQWLGRRGGTGCGSKQSEPALVRQLDTV